MKKIFYIFIGCVLLTSCSDYLDINEDPNNPQLSQLAPDNLLAAAMTVPFRTQAITMNEYGNVMSNSWAANVNAFTGGYRNEFTMNFTTSTRSAIWDNMYIGIGYLDNITKYPNVGGQYDKYIAVSKIMKSYYMQYIVDLYGNVPYSQAWQRGENLTPAYDDDKAIYFDLISQLIAARDMIDNAPASALDLNSQDVVFHGDTDDWKVFANTVELKMWLRVANLSDAELGTEFAQLRNDRLPILGGETFVSDDVIINPGYTGASFAQNNPFYSNWGPSITGSTAGTSRNFSVASSYMAKTLMGTQNNAHLNSVGVLDPRRSRIFRAVTSGPFTGQIVGVTQGDVTPAAGGTAPNPLSLIGVGITGYTGINAADAYNNGASKDGFLMLDAESQFLQAEATQRYPGFFTQDGKTLFQEGITASFQFHSRDVATAAIPDLPSPAAYLAATNLKQGLGWDGTADKLEAIMTQKWIALCGVHGIEPFLDLVRTGYPNVPLSIVANHTSKPRRLLYPSSEYTTNSANVPNVTLDQIFAVNSTSPFWVKN